MRSPHCSRPSSDFPAWSPFQESPFADEISRCFPIETRPLSFPRARTFATRSSPFFCGHLLSWHALIVVSFGLCVHVFLWLFSISRMIVHLPPARICSQYASPPGGDPALSRGFGPTSHLRGARALRFAAFLPVSYIQQRPFVLTLVISPPLFCIPRTAHSPGPD